MGDRKLIGKRLRSMHRAAMEKAPDHQYIPLRAWLKHHTDHRVREAYQTWRKRKRNW